LKTLLGAVLPLLLAACGSSYDPNRTIPADSKLQTFQPREEEELLDEAGLLEEDDEDADEVTPSAESSPEPEDASAAPAESE